jgi:methylenetetrahydrofolate dehydrogenase (NADP+)/methenyltetrahydrofolate cyclohydrolase
VAKKEVFTVNTVILDGRRIAQVFLDQLKGKVALLPTPPLLAVVLVGEHPPSQAYVKMKQKACANVGIGSRLIPLPKEVSQKELLQIVRELSEDPEVSGILVQLPLPPHLDADAVIAAIAPEKDVDGLHPKNLGLLVTESNSGFIPCTPKGILYLIQESGIELKGKKVVVLGRSLIVGKSLGILLLQKGISASVTILHSASENTERELLDAQVIIAALGKPRYLTKKMVAKGSVIVDVGITRVATADGGYQLQGDVDTESMIGHAEAITPVPGGVGPMTIAMLLDNTYLAHARQKRMT